LNEVKDLERYGCEKLDVGNTAEVKRYSQAIALWFEGQQSEIHTDEKGEKVATAGKESLSVLDKLKKGKKEALMAVKSNEKTTDKYAKENWDLIAWLTVK